MIPEPVWLTQGPELAPEPPEHCPICNSWLTDEERVDVDSICTQCDRDLAERQECVKAMLANPYPQCSGVEYIPVGTRCRYRQSCRSRAIANSGTSSMPSGAFAEESPGGGGT